MNTVKTGLGFATLAQMSRDGRNEILTRDLLVALAAVGTTTIHQNGEWGRRFHEALGSIHWHARVMVRKGEEWGIDQDRMTTFRSVSAMTAPSFITGSYDTFWSLVCCYCHGLPLEISRHGWVEIRMSEVFAQQHVQEQFGADYAVLLRRYAQCIVRHLIS